jgi:hypothetical protein
MCDKNRFVLSHALNPPNQNVAEIDECSILNVDPVVESLKHESIRKCQSVAFVTTLQRF